jgi:hypothetical protein
MISLSQGNAKLSKPNGTEYKIIGFGIPAYMDFSVNGESYNTCRGANACIKPCYARQGRYLMPNVKAAREKNLDATISNYFVNDMVEALRSKRSYNTVRVHDSGDFYNQEYLDKWYEIATKMPDRLFYAYTKALDLDLWTNKPSNFQIIQSLGGIYDRILDRSKSHSRIFSSHEAREKAGYIDGNVNDLPAITGEINIGLVYHGQKKLTLTQINYFS